MPIKETLAERLYALYVEYALGRTAPDSPRARTSREPFLRWLGWLAVWMKAGNQVEFVSKDLENLWAVSKHGIWPSGLFHSLIAGLAAGAIGGREIGLIVALGGAVLFRISQFVSNVLEARLVGVLEGDAGSDRPMLLGILERLGIRACRHIGESMVPRCAHGARLGSTLWTGRGNL